MIIKNIVNITYGGLRDSAVGSPFLVDESRESNVKHVDMKSECGPSTSSTSFTRTTHFSPSLPFYPGTLSGINHLLRNYYRFLSVMENFED